MAQNIVDRRLPQPHKKAFIYLTHQISRTPSNSPLEGEELRLPTFQGGTEGGKNLHGVLSI